MYAIIIKGGIIVVILLICSVISLTVFLERLWGLAKRRVCPAAFGNKIIALLKHGNYREAALLTEENHTPLSRLLGLTATYADTGREEELETILEEKGRGEISTISRDLEVISAIATIAPLLGLLGTVTGMIKVFQRIEAMGVGDPTVLASGIWEALITTAAGLIVAIPSFVLYKILSVKVEKLSLDIEDFLRQALEAVKHPLKDSSEQ